MNVLMMGGTGIISSEICNLAISKGDNVFLVNRGRREHNPNAKLIIADLKNSDIEDIKERISGESYDVVIDFVTYDITQLKRALAIINGNCKQYIFISTATVYNTKAVGEQYTENDDVGNTGWNYANDKVLCEKYLQEHAKDYNIEYTIVRPYVTYGKTRIPYQVCPLKYYTIINRIVNAKPIPLFGDEVKCTVTNATDFAVGLYGLLLNKEAFSEIYNIVGNTVTTWREIIETIGNILNINVNVVELNTNILNKKRLLGFDADEILCDKARNMVFDNSKIRKTVPEFEDTISLYDGLLQTISFLEEHPSLCEIDYSWDARIDSLLARNKCGIDKGSICFGAYKNDISINSQREYKRNRNDFVFACDKVVKRIKRIIRP